MQICDSTKISPWKFVKVTERPRNLVEALQEKVPRQLFSYLPRSFDVIGDVAVVELSDQVESFAAAIGLVILEINPHVRLVTRKLGCVTGPHRTRKLIPIAGTGGMETTHHEFSCSYVLNLESVYFNPRLSNERFRVANQVQDHESVVDMFTGVGPFSILIARMHPNVRVHACDINPAAIKYLNENILLNRVATQVTSYLGDANELSQKGFHAWANRVIMNLPANAVEYLPVAVDLLKPNGTLHYYAFATRNENLEDVKPRVAATIERTGRSVQTFSFAKSIREISPLKIQVAIDAIIG
jgi:tRNA (guanine37-N1)-methyltransferase